MAIDLSSILRLMAPQQRMQSQSSNALRALAILMKHKDKNFVQRALYPQNSPSYDRGDFHGSHYMGWTTVNGPGGKPQHIVYPNIVQKTPEAGLTMLDGKDAVRYALKTGEYIPFDDPKEADWFSQQYKSIWPYNRQNGAR